MNDKDYTTVPLQGVVLIIGGLLVSYLLPILAHIALKVFYVGLAGFIVIGLFKVIKEKIC